MCPKPDGGNTITANVTTAQALAAYRDELISLDFHPSTILELVQDAAHLVVSRELRVNVPEPAEAVAASDESHTATMTELNSAVEAVEKLTGVSILETMEKLFGGPLYEDTWLTMQKFKHHNE